jgi:hypothetical protein
MINKKMLEIVAFGFLASMIGCSKEQMLMLDNIPLSHRATRCEQVGGGFNYEDARKAMVEGKYDDYLQKCSDEVNTRK